MLAIVIAGGAAGFVIWQGGDTGTAVVADAVSEPAAFSIDRACPRCRRHNIATGPRARHRRARGRSACPARLRPLRSQPAQFQRPYRRRDLVPHQGEGRTATGRARSAAASGVRESFDAGASYAGEPRGKDSASVGVFIFGSNDPNKALSYEGKFNSAGILGGYGAYDWRSGERYFGAFANNSTSGACVQELVDGKRREGEEINWRRNGFHVLRDRNGKVEAAGTAANDTITTALTR